MSIYSPEMSAMMNENEEKNVLSNRRAVILIFFIGVVILSLLFLIRLDIDIKYGNVGERATIVKKTSPIFKEPIQTAINFNNKKISHIEDGGEESDVIASRTVSSLQRDPRVLLTSSFGLYNRTDYMKK
ncbi:ORF80 [White spot syndrome virus]|uniref:Wsv136 n=3 Tax=White spot syndrome virus TaxID=342409 RepID=Q77J71_WSSVS|nr:wsv136 [Shrimp white spot syndrome virus]YP_009220518.1 hypothetical protein SWSSV_gp044 [White spot syndrome virus]AYW76538.1 hypothetical protein [Procambarus clarkii virus]AAK77749.1 ORF80 [White spot syndrome virus]AAL33140.1 wsv136 [Shrimp white spot syndrome virus]AAL89059.1 WSSV191 [Shrimp white spot syndrome virus]AFX59512.1 wsv136 [White spot syndrome virus]